MDVGAKMIHYVGKFRRLTMSNPQKCFVIWLKMAFFTQKFIFMLFFSFGENDSS